MGDHTDDLARTDAPERIWVDFAEYPSGAMIGSVYTSDLGDIPYILATPAALAASPEVQALLAAARAEADALREDAERKDRAIEGWREDLTNERADTNALRTALAAEKARADALEAELRDWRNGDLRGVQAHFDAFKARADAAEALVKYGADTIATILLLDIAAALRGHERVFLTRDETSLGPRILEFAAALAQQPPASGDDGRG